MSYSRALKKIALLNDVQSKYNVFCHVNQLAAKQLDQTESSEKLLQNVMIGMKDNIATKDMPTTCASMMLKSYKSPFDATVVRLLKDEGAVIAGKTNLDEFGMGSGGIHSAFGPTINPLSLEEPLVAGGSSSGSASAVAADVVDVAIGTDTGGSIRLPAAYTSIYGFKPSYGRISRFGVIAYAQSLDTVGIMAKDFKMIPKTFKILDQFDPKDPTSMTNDCRETLLRSHCEKTVYKIGVVQEFSQTGLDPGYKKLYLQFIQKLIDQGHQIVSLSIPSIKYALPIYYTLASSEAASNLSRYDGIRYGLRDSKSDIVDGTLFAPTRNNFGDAVKNRIILGNYSLCSDSFKNNYIKAQKLRVKLIDEFDSIFSSRNIYTGSKGHISGVDAIICPTAMSGPATVRSFKESLNNKSPVNEYVNDVFTMPMSLAGLPTVSVPLGNKTKYGVQIIGQYGDDYNVLDLAQHSCE